MKSAASLLPRRLRTALPPLLLALALPPLAASAGERVAVYDSRALAYAHFLGTGQQERLQALAAEGRQARATGDRERFRAIEREMTDRQRVLHLQVFSTAPCTEALAALGDRTEAVRREAGCARLVSRWDDTALAGVAESDRMDVTAALLRDLPLTEKQRRLALEITTKKPLPLWQARMLAWLGRL